MEELNETKNKLNARAELDKINSKTIFEFKKTVDNFQVEKIKGYVAKDGNKSVSLLFYGNDFIAVDRVNFKNGYEYEKNKEKDPISENLNYKIKKIPNVAKTRKILNIEDIETRIYDVSEYIVLLKKENMKLLKVNGENDISRIYYAEYEIDKEKLLQNIEEYERIEDEELKEENNFTNRIKSFMKTFLHKLFKSNDVKMLSDGKNSIFDK